MQLQNNHENHQKKTPRALAFAYGRREPLLVTKSIAGMLVTAGGPRANTPELRTDFFEAENAAWQRTRGACGQFDACDALLGEPYGRWA